MTDLVTFQCAVSHVTAQESLTGVHEERPLNAQIQDLVPQLCPRWVSTHQCSACGWPSRLLILLALPPEPLPRLLTKHKCRSAHPLQLPFNTEAFVSRLLVLKVQPRLKMGRPVAVQGQVAGRCRRGLGDTAVVQLQRLQCLLLSSAFVHGCLGVWTSGCPAHGPLWVALSRSHLTADGHGWEWARTENYKVRYSHECLTKGAWLSGLSCVVLVFTIGR